MLQIPSSEPVNSRNLSPEQWDNLKSEIIARAREARSRVLRDFLAWVARRGTALVQQSSKAYLAWRNRRAAVRELQSLDNRMLRDMGIARSEIEWLVAGGEENFVAQRRAVTARKTGVQGIIRKPATGIRKRAA